MYKTAILITGLAVLITILYTPSLPLPLELQAYLPRTFVEFNSTTITDKLPFNFKRALGGLSAAAPKSSSTITNMSDLPKPSVATMAPAGSTPVSRSVTKKVYAGEVEEGVGARVRRSIGSPQLKNLSPFLMLDHFHISKGAGFDDHPHRGQATVTYMLQGASRHEDSEGIRARL
jgi:hypothetical protein